jgi:hypothetical protein
VPAAAAAAAGGGLAPVLAELLLLLLLAWRPCWRGTCCCCWGWIFQIRACCNHTRPQILHHTWMPQLRQLLHLLQIQDLQHTPEMSSDGGFSIL